MYFIYYRLPKIWLDQCLKSPVSGYLSKRNMVKAPKYCSNLKESLFTKLINHWEVNCSTKSFY